MHIHIVYRYACASLDHCIVYRYMVESLSKFNLYLKHIIYPPINEHVRTNGI